MNLTFYTDPGHGWLQVMRSQLEVVGLRPESFSRYSYCNGDTFFLEEDCDAPKFLACYRRTFGTDPTIIEKNENRDSFIRSLRRINMKENA